MNEIIQLELVTSPVRRAKIRRALRNHIFARAKRTNNYCLTDGCFKLAERGFLTCPQCNHNGKGVQA